MVETKAPSGKQKELSKISNLVKKSFALYKKSFWDLISLQLIQLAAVLGFRFLMAAGGDVLGVLIVGILISLVTITTSLAMIYVVHLKSGVTAALRAALKNLMSYAWVTLLGSLIITGGMILFIVPGVIFAVWFALAVYVLVIEKKKGLAAFLASKEYVRGRWWPTLGRLLVLVGLAILVGALSGAGGAVGGKQLGELVGFLVNVLFAPFAVSYLYLLYGDLSKTKPSGAVSKVPKENKWVFVSFAVLGLLVWLMMPLILGALYIAVGSLSGNFENSEGIGPIEIDPGEDFDFSDIDPVSI
ncbi:MAG: hypothetical protein U1C52_00550 [Patescibacteria group bacterium]|nr:hypothetical protein [Patescibacteria group bacterium]